MKICIDCRMWGEKYGGIGRYVKEIVLNLLERNNWKFILIVAIRCTISEPLLIDLNKIFNDNIL